MAELDFLSVLIGSLHYDIITFISLIISNEVSFGLLLFFLTLVAERRPEKLKKVIIVLACAFLISTLFKLVFQVERPCVAVSSDKIICPTSYSFPSTHAALAFVLPLAFLNKRSYPFYLLFALFVGFSRIYLSVHSVVDVAAGLVVAAVSYYAVDLLKANLKDS